jgi:hypothetical protein
MPNLLRDNIPTKLFNPLSTDFFSHNGIFHHEQLLSSLFSQPMIIIYCFNSIIVSTTLLPLLYTTKSVSSLHVETTEMTTLIPI